VHLRQRQRHPPPRATDVEEHVTHRRRRPDVVLDDVERVLERALQVGRQVAAQPVQVPEDPHEARRIAAQGVGVTVGQVQAAVVEHQAVDQGLLALAALGRAPARQRLLAARDEPSAHAMDPARVQVVLAHEALDAEGVAVVGVAEVLGDLRLQVARQHVVLVAGEEVQLVARAPQEGERGVGARLLARRDESLVGQLAQRAGAELGRAQPHRRVHVAQAAGRLLDVGLADVGRGAELAVALLALGQRHRQELAEVLAVDVVAQDAAEAREESPVALDQPRLLHRGAAGEVGAGHGHAVLQRAQAVAHLQAEVPQRVEQLLHDPLHERRQLPVVDDHEVDVRRGVQLATSVAAQRDHHERNRRQPGPADVGHDEPGERLHHAVDEAGVRADGFLTRRPLDVHGLEGVQSLGEGAAEEFEPQAAPVLGTFGSRLGAPGAAVQLGRHGGSSLTAGQQECQTSSGTGAATVGGLNRPGPGHRVRSRSDTRAEERRS